MGFPWCHCEHCIKSPVRGLTKFQAFDDCFNSARAKAKALGMLDKTMEGILYSESWHSWSIEGPNSSIFTNRPRPSAPTNPSTSTTMSTSIASASSVPPSSALSRRFQTGILAGGIVSGFMVLVLFVIFISWCVVRRRRRRRIAPSTAYRAQLGVAITVTQSYHVSSRVGSPEMTKASVRIHSTFSLQCLW